VRLQAGIAVHQLDVGLGNCVLVVDDSGPTAMIDTGSTQSVAAVLAYMQGLNLKTVDVLLISHADRDHFAGAAPLAEAGVCFKHVWDNGHITNLPWVAQEEAAHYQRTFGNRRATLTAGMRWSLGSNTMLRCLYACGRYADGTRIDYDRVENNASAVILLTHGKYRQLFPGDIHVQVEEQLPRVCGPVSALTLAHHGIDGSSTAALLRHLRPLVTLISSPGLLAAPAPAVMDRLEEIGTDVYLTRRGRDPRGTVVTNIVIRTDGRTGFTVAGRHYRAFGEARSPWRRIILVTTTIIICYGLLRAALAGVSVAHR
jgi:competence protein ComEC